MTNPTPAVRTVSKERLRTIRRKQMRYNWDVYLMALPGLLFLLFFSYAPMYGIIIAFKKYRLNLGILGSKWVGLKNFQRLMHSPEFKRALRNTLVISFSKIILGMPVPIIFSLLLNELRGKVFKRAVQTVVYIPHFISWVVVAGIFNDMLSPSSGIINKALNLLGINSIYFLGSNKWIRPVIYFTDIWKEFGWGTIIYLAAITGVDPQLYEAAAIDGAGRFKQVIHVTLPAIFNTFIVMLLMRLGNIMTGAGFEQIFMLYSEPVYEKVDILDTYIYRQSFQAAMDFSYSTACGLFSSLVGCCLLVSSNTFVKKLGGRGMYQERSAQSMTIRTRGERIFNVINIIIVTLVGLLCLAPFIHVIAAVLQRQHAPGAQEGLLLAQGVPVG